MLDNGLCSMDTNNREDGLAACFAVEFGKLYKWACSIFHSVSVRNFWYPSAKLLPE